MKNIDFKIVVPVYNSELWIEDCVNSIKNQNHKEFKCIIIDDNSSDNTGKVLDSMVLDERFIILHNEKNYGALYNIVNGFKLLKTKEEPESVLMAIDGDDKLSSINSLEIVNKFYNLQPKLMLTYGNWLGSNGLKSNCKHFPKDVLESRSFRTYPLFVTSHLRTFKSKLWNSIKEKDLVNPTTEEYWRVAWDCAFMYPMLEMAGNNRICFIENILYTYNRDNPISDDVVRQKEQTRVFNYIRSMPKYNLLEEIK